MGISLGWNKNIIYFQREAKDRNPIETLAWDFCKMFYKGEKCPTVERYVFNWREEERWGKIARIIALCATVDYSPLIQPVRELAQTGYTDVKMFLLNEYVSNH